MEDLDLVLHGRISSIQQLSRRSGSSSGSNCGPNPCEKPTSSSTFTLPIILGAAVPLVGAAILFLILQRRHTRKIREEDANDRHASLDFGLGDAPISTRPMKGVTQSPNKEKSSISGRQVSMDMTMSNPYLLSLESKNSRESLDSLSLPLRKEDPYRPVSQFIASESANSRPQTRAGSSGNNIPNESQPKHHDIQEPTPNVSVNCRNRSADSDNYPARYNSPLPYQQTSNVDQGLSNQIIYPTELPQAYMSPDPGMSTNGWASGLPLNSHLLQPQFLEYDNSMGIENSNSLPGNRSPVNSGYQNPDQTLVYDSTGFYEGETVQQFNSLPIHQSQSHDGELEARYMNNNLDHRAPVLSDQYDSNMWYTQEQHYQVEDQQQNLNPVFGNGQTFQNRLSVLGTRPLPPKSAIESDDPEIRANRIRSFYKEYFDDSAPISNHRLGNNNYSNQSDDYFYCRPDSSQFIPPHDQRISRRALTPPPKNTSIVSGRPRNGSMGTSNSDNRLQYHAPDMRPYSSSSGGQQFNHRKPTLPFVELNQIPTPGKMRNDVSSINSLSYAPPITYRAGAGSRPEAPLIARQRSSNSNSMLPEPSPIPSPHQLQSSEKFSSLNFAPPKKFREPDSNSDAGSIRSNRSTKSNLQTGLTQNSSHRIDQLPEDVVFTRDGLNSTLKPQWDMSR